MYPGHLPKPDSRELNDFFDFVFKDHADSDAQSKTVAKPRVSSVNRESEEIVAGSTVDALVAKLESMTWPNQPNPEVRYSAFIDCWFQCFPKMRTRLPVADRVSILQAFIKLAQSFPNEKYLYAWRLIVPQFNQLGEAERSILRASMDRLAAKRELYGDGDTVYHAQSPAW